MPRCDLQRKKCSCGKKSCKESNKCIDCWKSSVKITFTKFLEGLTSEQLEVTWYDCEGFSVQNKLKYTCSVHGDGELTKKHLGYLKGRTPCRGCRDYKKSQQYLEDCLIKHKSKYQYPDGVGCLNDGKIRITCPHHGDFYQTLKEHRGGRGCRDCGNRKLSLLKSMGRDEFISRAKKIHGDLYCYDEVSYLNTMKSVDIICPIHGVFKQLPGNHLSGKGCLLCFKSRMVSKLELDVKQFILDLGIRLQNNVRVVNYEVDTVLLDFNVGFEVNGSYWHSNKFRKKFDHQNKSIEIIDRGIYLGYIWEHDWVNCREVVQDRIRDAAGILPGVKIDEVCESGGNSVVCLQEGKVLGSYSRSGKTITDLVVSSGISRVSVIRNLVENWGVSSIEIDLDHGELMRDLSDLGFRVVGISEPRKFSINQYPLKRVDGLSGSLIAYDAGSITLERKTRG